MAFEFKEVEIEYKQSNRSEAYAEYRKQHRLLESQGWKAIFPSVTSVGEKLCGYFYRGDTEELNPYVQEAYKKFVESQRVIKIESPNRYGILFGRVPKKLKMYSIGSYGDFHGQYTFPINPFHGRAVDRWMIGSVYYFYGVWIWVEHPELRQQTFLEKKIRSFFGSKPKS